MRTAAFVVNHIPILLQRNPRVTFKNFTLERKLGSDCTGKNSTFSKELRHFRQDCVAKDGVGDLTRGCEKDGWGKD
jgi:hypothetical protein